MLALPRRLPLFAVALLAVAPSASARGIGWAESVRLLEANNAALN